MPLPPQANQVNQASKANQPNQEKQFDQPGGGLNPFQANRLVVTCHYIDRLLADTESILDPRASNAAFPRYEHDVSPAECAGMQKQITEMRAQMVAVLHDLEIPSEPPSIPASRAVHALLDAIDIAVQELRPRYMRGYGAVASKAAAHLDTIVGKFSNLVIEMNHSLLHSPRQ